MKHFKLIPIFLTLLFAIGCSNDEPKPQPNPEPTPEPTPEPNPDDGWVWDYNPAQVMVEVNDADGNHLFSDNYHGMLDCENLSTAISYTYNGETKPLYDKKPESTLEAKSPKSRYFMPTFYGLYVDYYSVEYPRIRFGEFDGEESHDETFIINWPDGTHNKIDFTSEARKGYDSILVRVDDGEWRNTFKVTFVK
ncbi:MAG: hypothetical protein NC241_00480 [Bacteroides sp.]|nr:hypothetical protein [Bacteroides sp.]MCM1458438.1 hypothetical protein [Lachnoclostridium sp.]